jgi:hypothetical protein
MSEKTGKKPDYVALLALIHSFFFGSGYISNITPDFYENK